MDKQTACCINTLGVNSDERNVKMLFYFANFYYKLYVC